MTPKDSIFSLGDMVAHRDGRTYVIVGIRPDGYFDLGLTPDGVCALQSPLEEFCPIEDAVNALLAEALASGEISPDQFVGARFPPHEDGVSARTALSSLGPALWTFGRDGGSETGY